MVHLGRLLHDVLVSHSHGWTLRDSSLLMNLFVVHLSRMVGDERLALLGRYFAIVVVGAIEAIHSPQVMR